MCVECINAHVCSCSLQRWGYHTLIITPDSLQQWGSPTSPAILHLLASFIFLQPSVSTSMPAQHTLNYEHIINSVDTPGGLEGLRPHPTQALNGPLALWGAQKEDLRSKSGDLMLKDNKSAQSLNTMHPYFKRLLCFHFYFTAQAWLQIIFFTLF